MYFCALRKDTWTLSFAMLVALCTLLPTASGTCTWQSTTYANGARITTQCGVVCVCRPFNPYAATEPQYAAWGAGDKWDCFRIRKEATKMSAAEILDYANAVKAVLADGGASNIIHTLGSIHNTGFSSGIHTSGAFLPWHREFLFEMETALRKKNCKVTLPYFDSAKSAVDLSASTIWSSTRMGGLPSSCGNPSQCVPDGPFVLPGYYVPGGACLRRRKTNCPGTVVKDDVFIAAMLLASAYSTFSQQLENDVHNHVHVYIGGVMATGASPNEPVFYQHHAFIDKLWLDWQTRSGGVNRWKYSTWSGLDTTIDNHMPFMDGTGTLAATTPRMMLRNRWQHIDKFPQWVGGVDDNVPTVTPGMPWVSVCYKTSFFSCGGKWWIIALEPLFPIVNILRLRTTTSVTLSGASFLPYLPGAPAYLDNVPRLYPNQTTWSVDEWFNLMGDGDMRMQPDKVTRDAYVQYQHEYPPLYGKDDDYPSGYDHNTVYDDTYGRPYGGFNAYGDYTTAAPTYAPYTGSPTDPYTGPPYDPYTQRPYDPYYIPDSPYDMFVRESPSRPTAPVMINSFFDVFFDISINEQGPINWHCKECRGVLLGDDYPSHPPSPNTPTAPPMAIVSMVLRGDDGMPATGYSTSDFVVHYDAQPDTPSYFEKTPHPCDCAFVLQYTPRTAEPVKFMLPGGIVQEVPIPKIPELELPVDPCALVRCADGYFCIGGECKDRCILMRCNDLNPCTKDWCEAGRCRNAPLPDGTPCARSTTSGALGVCVKGVCQVRSCCDIYSKPGYEYNRPCPYGTFPVCCASGRWTCENPRDTYNGCVRGRPCGCLDYGSYDFTAPDSAGALTVAGQTADEDMRSDDCILDPSTQSASRYVLMNGFCHEMPRPCSAARLYDSAPQCMEQCQRCCPMEREPGYGGNPMCGSLQTCGGIANLQCPAGETCVDDPNDNCDPNQGGADCGGICTQKPYCCDGQWKCTPATVTVAAAAIDQPLWTSRDVAVNAAVRPLCLSSTICPCSDLDGYDFGMCRMLLGYAVVAGQCRAVGGCRAPFRLFAKLEDCLTRCPQKCCPMPLPECKTGATCCSDGTWNCNGPRGESMCTRRGRPCDCVDHQDDDFGQCGETLGVTVMGSVCTEVKGCATLAQNVQFFKSTDECNAACLAQTNRLSSGMCCDAALEPGTGDNARCRFGHQCCDNGEWRCNRASLNAAGSIEIVTTCAQAEAGRICSCRDLSGVSFGACEAILGWGMMNGICQAISGCSVPSGLTLFASEVDCTTKCPPLSPCENPKLHDNADLCLQTTCTSTGGAIRKCVHDGQRCACAMNCDHPALQISKERCLSRRCLDSPGQCMWNPSAPLGKQCACADNAGCDQLHLQANPDLCSRETCLGPDPAAGKLCVYEDKQCKCPALYAKCEEVPYELCERFDCPGQPTIQWSPWISLDNPAGVGDVEKVGDVLSKLSIPCNQALQIECRERSTGLPWTATGLHYICDINVGGVCLHADNPGKKCPDFEVRVSCQPAKRKCQRDGEKSCRCTEPECNQVPLEECPKHNCPAQVIDPRWSPWLDRDDPSGTGDWEVWTLLQTQAGLNCDVPAGIQCKDLSTGALWDPSSPTQNLVCSPSTGLVCKNADNAATGGCHDYAVRFTCDPAPKKCQVFSTAAGLKRCDCPRDGCDYQENHANPQLCMQTFCPSTTTGVVPGSRCVYNTARRQCMCPPAITPDECTVYTKKETCVASACPTMNSGVLTWSPWINRDRPTATGDWETIQQMLPLINLPCPWPHAIQCREVGTHLDWTLVGDTNYRCDITAGGICQNQFQPAGRQCHDYEVRVACKAPDPKCVWRQDPGTAAQYCACPPKDSLCQRPCRKLYLVPAYNAYLPGYSMPAGGDGYVRVSPSDISYSAQLDSTKGTLDLSFTLPILVGGLQYVSFEGMDPSKHRLPQDLPPHSLEREDGSSEVPLPALMWNNLPPCYNNTIPSLYRPSPPWTVTMATPCAWLLQASIPLWNSNVRRRDGSSALQVDETPDATVISLRSSAVYMQPGEDMANSYSYVTEKHDYSTVLRISRAIQASGGFLMLRILPSYLVLNNRPQLQLQLAVGAADGSVRIMGARVLSSRAPWNTRYTDSIVYLEPTTPGQGASRFADNIRVRIDIACEGLQGVQQCSNGYIETTITPDLANYVRTTNANLQVNTKLDTGYSGGYATPSTPMKVHVSILDFATYGFTSVRVDDMRVTCGQWTGKYIEKGVLLALGRSSATSITQGRDPDGKTYNIDISFSPSGLPPGPCNVQITGYAQSNGRSRMRGLAESNDDSFEISRSFTNVEDPSSNAAQVTASGAQQEGSGSAPLTLILTIAGAVLGVAVIAAVAAVVAYRRRSTMMRVKSNAEMEASTTS